jgi:hypothetical protein
MKPTIKKDGHRTYNVIGKSGNTAGYIQQVGTVKNRAWEVAMLSSQTTVHFGFKAAKEEAITKAERY